MHPYSVGGAPRFWYLISRAAGLSIAVVLGVALYLLIPEIPPTTTPSVVGNMLVDAFADAGAWLLLISVAIAVGAAVEYSASQKAWSTVPGDHGGRSAVRTPDGTEASVPRRVQLSLLIMQMALVTGIAIALTSRGLIGSILVVWFAICVMLLALSRMRSDTYVDFLVATVPVLPGLILALSVLVQSDHLLLLLAFPLILGAVISVLVLALGALFRRASAARNKPSASPS